MKEYFRVLYLVFLCTALGGVFLIPAMLSGSYHNDNFLYLYIITFLLIPVLLFEINRIDYKGGLR